MEQEKPTVHPATTSSRGVAADASSPPEPSTPSAPSPLDSQDLLQGRNAVAIAHNGALYRLQTTRQGKLILTK
jgi:hemin uptake protein HemP